MKITFFGYDYSMDVAQRLMQDGHEIIQIFTFPCDNQFSFNIQIKAFAEHYKIPITEDPIEPSFVHRLIKDGCNLFLCSGYTKKIPNIDETQAYGINVHPSLLPRCRGIMPLPYVITKEREAAGFTIHKLVSTYDAGDILYQERVHMSEDTDVETLGARIAIKAPNAVSQVVNDIERFWQNATPQNHAQATNYPVPNSEFRKLDWTETAKNISYKTRAFGRYGVLARIENNIGQSQNLIVANLSCWSENHGVTPGTLIRSSPREIVVAIRDGYACLKEFHVIKET
ncbi:MAG: hypothetical protein GC137_10635 [Alphaproteobacteria bacterium]|nr:hypothetical protein [Alphaproteobacteria bacterium]